MRTAEIAKALIGKAIRYYNRWNGECSEFVIGHIEAWGDSIRVRQGKNKGWGVFIPKAFLSTLLEFSYYAHMTHINGSCFIEEWQLTTNN